MVKVVEIPIATAIGTFMANNKAKLATNATTDMSIPRSLFIPLGWGGAY